MRFIPIREVRYDASTGELRVVPADQPGPDYGAVYRAAMSARADESDELCTVNFTGRTPIAGAAQPGHQARRKGGRGSGRPHRGRTRLLLQQQAGLGLLRRGSADVGQLRHRGLLDELSVDPSVSNVDH